MSEEPEGINLTDKEIKDKTNFESRKQELRDKQENIHENKDNPYVKITIPDKGKIGGKCKIKFSKKVPRAQIAISQNITWKKVDKYDRTSKPELVCRAFILKEFKDVKEIEVQWEDMGILAEKPTNMLQAGEFMVEARAWSTEFGEETTARRLIRVE